MLSHPKLQKTQGNLLTFKKGLEQIGKLIKRWLKLMLCCFRLKFL